MTRYEKFLAFNDRMEELHAKHPTRYNMIAGVLALSGAIIVMCIVLFS